MANKKYAVKVSPAANDKMYKHIEFVARVSVPAAENLLAKLITDINSLSEMPLRNPEFNRPRLKEGKYRYMLSNKRYRIIYQVTSNRDVLVDDIQDCRQDEDKSLV